MQKPLKRVIAVEIHSDTKEKRFELFEVLQKYCVCISGECKQSQINEVEKRAIGYFSVSSNDWIIKGSRISKKPEYQHLQTTKIKTTLSLYGDEPETYDELIAYKPQNLHVVDIYLHSATHAHRILIKSAIHKELKRFCPHFKIKVERVFFHTPQKSDYKDAAFYSANELGFPVYENLFDSQNAALCAINEINAANSAYLQTNLI